MLKCWANAQMLLQSQPQLVLWRSFICSHMVKRRNVWRVIFSISVEGIEHYIIDVGNGAFAHLSNYSISHCVWKIGYICSNSLNMSIGWYMWVIERSNGFSCMFRSDSRILSCIITVQGSEITIEHRLKGLFWVIFIQASISCIWHFLFYQNKLIF